MGDITVNNAIHTFHSL